MLKGREKLTKIRNSRFRFQKYNHTDLMENHKAGLGLVELLIGSAKLNPVLIVGQQYLFFIQKRESVSDCSKRNPSKIYR